MDSIYRKMQELVHEIIATAFSNRVITPGVTTTEDVVWWMRQRVNDLGLGTWFQPSVSVQRRGVDMADSTAPVILRGDVLHCDFGITALGLNTDTQHMGYVLREGESEPPAGLKRALANANRLQDIVLAEMRPGRTGNEVLASALAQMRSEGINGTVYTHPIGDYGHGAGPLIGLCRSFREPGTRSSCRLPPRFRSGTASRCGSRWRRKPSLLPRGRCGGS
jgi:Xaa-Pro aminopeptidase